MTTPDVNAHANRYGPVLDLLARKLLEDEGRIGVAFPYVTDASGAWRTMLASESAGYRPDGWTHGNWFCGFWVGLLVAAHLWTRKPLYLALAEERMRLVAERANDPNTHDIGFIFLSSALPLWQVTGDQRHQDVALKAADQLRRRLVMTERGAYISSWGPMTDPRGRCSSAIDTMANIPLLYWAAQASGDAGYALAGVAHAEMTRAFIRPDHSTFHAVEYDPVSGARKRGYTFQGSSDSSFWSRGQCWAIRGYVATALATGIPSYVTLAETLAERFLERLGPMPVPPYDFDDASPTRPLDSSAGAILVSSLLDIAALQSDPARAAHWQKRALTLLDNLIRECLAREDTHRGMLKHGCYSWPHRDGVDSAVMFGDYYFIEAACKLAMPGRFTPVLSALS